MSDWRPGDGSRLRYVAAEQEANRARLAAVLEQHGLTPTTDTEPDDEPVTTEGDGE